MTQPDPLAALAEALLPAIRNFLSNKVYKDWTDEEAQEDLSAYVLPSVLAALAAAGWAVVRTEPVRVAVARLPAASATGADGYAAPAALDVRPFIESVAATSNDPHLAHEAQRILRRLDDPEAAALAAAGWAVVKDDAVAALPVTRQDECSCYCHDQEAESR